VIFGNNVTILHHFRVTVTYSVCGCLRPWEVLQFILHRVGR